MVLEHKSDSVQAWWPRRLQNPVVLLERMFYHLADGNKCMPVINSMIILFSVVQILMKPHNRRYIVQVAKDGEVWVVRLVALS